MSDIQKQLRNWAEETANAYHNLATDPAHPECNLAFHTQSDLTKIDGQPELLILAINPNADAFYTHKGSDQGQIENVDWNIPNGMTGDKLLQGNPFYPNRGEWSLWKRLHKILSYGGVENLLANEKKLVYTNLILYTTKEAKLIPPAARELKEHCIKLIDILKPKHILCLSIKWCFNNLTLDNGSIQTLIQNRLKFGRINGIPVYGIPHTASRYSTAAMELIGSCLGYLFKIDNSTSITAETIAKEFGDKIVAFKNKQSDSKRSHIDFEELKARLNEKFGEPYEVKPNKDKAQTVRYNFAENVQLTATTTQGGYLGIGHKPQTKELPDRESRRTLLKKYNKWNRSKSDVWYQCKAFHSFDNIDDIIKELGDIQKEWTKL